MHTAKEKSEKRRGMSPRMISLVLAAILLLSIVMFDGPAVLAASLGADGGGSFILPPVGGQGTTMFNVVGMALMVAAIAGATLFAYKRHKAK
ncbi:MAG: hypothetical protein FWF44_08935 [Defluviitaleaceae bacterium]|nr:hypothetical protein [Defluviitaleaceae bacterium]